MNLTIDPTRRAAIDAAHDRQSEARATLEIAAQALQRAEANAKKWRDQEADAESNASANETERAQQLIEHFTAGKPHAALPGEIDSKQHAELARARINSSVAEKTLAALQATHDNAVAEVKAAESAVIAAAKALVLGEGEAMAAEILHHESEALRLRESLLGLRGSDIDRRTGELLTCAAIERAMVESASEPRYLPALAIENGAHRTRIAAAERHWLKRIASLIEGDSPEAGDKAA